MSPSHGNFHRAQTMMPREIQQFGVESEAFDGLLLEHDGATLAAERFEAALRVYERQPKDDSYEFVENDSGEFAEAGFMNRDQASVDGPRADGQIVLLQCLNELVGFFNRRGKIGVREKHNPASRFLHAVAHAVALAPVDSVRYHSKRGDLGLERLRNCG